MPAVNQSKIKIPGEEGIWVFVFGDLIIFTLFFAVFLSYREDAVDLFRVSANALNVMFGVSNTLLLLVSSWFMVSALKAFRLGNINHFRRFVALALVCGFSFAVLKFFEYQEKISSGYGLTSNDFYMFYFVLTGIHLFHVIVGMVILSWLLSVSFKNADGLVESNVEVGAVFWHMVDLLWILLFPILYLLP